MKIPPGRRFLVLALVLLLAPTGLVAAGAVAWQTGRVTAIEINGQSVTANANSRVVRKDLWWAYSICTGTRTYKAASRVSPARLGIEVDSTVTFSATTIQITLRDARGKQYVMRILRRTETKDCTGR